VSMKRILWVVAQCSSERVKRFGGKYRLHLQERGINGARNKQKQQALKMEAIFTSETSGFL
jgi:hypothetical protein